MRNSPPDETMDTVAKGPLSDAALDLNLVDSADWTQQTTEESMNSNTLVYIAVEYVKDECKPETPHIQMPPEDNFGELEEHVSPLDPNMSSVARYSPVYNESSDYNPIVIHQLVGQQSQENADLQLPSELPVMCNNDIRVENQYLQMVSEPADQLAAGLQLVQDNQEVILITDQTTGISYSVRSQDFVVEEEQLLSTLGNGSLLDTDLLTLDDTALKSELSDEIVTSAVISNYISNLSVEDIKNAMLNDTKINTRSKIKLEEENQAPPKMYSITDKPVLSRAWASLPETYLVIDEDGNGVFAKKTIPKNTQFGPLMGVVKHLSPEYLTENSDELKLIVEHEDGSYYLDITDPNVANWMCFVRKASNYNEQNLIVIQQGSFLYYTTIRPISSKEELKIGYGIEYATKYKLPVFVQMPAENSWPCFECNDTFATSDELQKHLNIHDKESDENTKPKRRPRFNKKKQQVPKMNNNQLMKCKDCNEVFAMPEKRTLRQHLIEKHIGSRMHLLEQYFVAISKHKCNNCELVFELEPLLKIHNFQHSPDDSDELTNHICPACQRKFPTQRQLVWHVASHALDIPKAKQTFKCSICRKSFACGERLRSHMMVHGADELKPLQCKTCNRRFLTRSALTGHLQSHYAGKKLFECPICKETFDHVLKLKLHVPKHSVNNRFHCPHCAKIFDKYSIIRKHIRAFHCDQKHTCPHCPKTFPTADKLKMHLLRHSDHKEFLCADCGRQFKRKDKLNEHCKRLHADEWEQNEKKATAASTTPLKRSAPRVEQSDFHLFIYKCHSCLVGFKRRGMLVNHLAKRHPDISPDSVPELNLPILQTTRDYYCQHCEKVYKSSSKRKAHILKKHPGATLPLSNRKHGDFPGGLPNPTFSQTVGSITTRPQNCKWCHKQYASKAKLLQHQRKKHTELLERENQMRERQEEERSEAVVETKVDEVQSDYLKKVLEECNGDQFLVAMSEHFDSPDLITSNSHLYRLLTTNGDVTDLVPPR